MTASRTIALLATTALLAACGADAPTTPATPTGSARRSIAAGEAGPQRSHGERDLGADLGAVRAATARYHRVDVAVADGYENTHQCVAVPGAGMGVHYVNGARVGDGVLDPSRPEVLVYEPQADGSLRLVAVEYMIPRPMWDAMHPGTHPALFGAAFEAGPMNSYALHAWVWRQNPAGTFAAFNPAVRCPGGAAAGEHAGHS